MTKGSNRSTFKVEPEPEELPAGEFSGWLRLTRRAQQLKNLGADVPCGTCTACCRSSLFIHIRPDEIRTLARIPKALLFPAPRLPKGHVLMGYDEQGKCPMLIENKCSIYEDRPQTCRDYDCRVLAATGIELNDSAQALIARQARRWRFAFSNDRSHEEYSAVQATAVFLQEHRSSFPADALPNHPNQLAILAIKVYEVFLSEGLHGSAVRPADTEIAKAVMAALERFEANGPQ